MTAIVPPDRIEEIVGTQRHSTRHYARAVGAEQTVYILHSETCRDTTPDLRTCRFSLALDRGIDVEVWAESQDQAVRVTITRSGRLIPVRPGMKLADQ